MEPAGCIICFNDFDEKIYIPLILTKCGHSFCQVCVKQMSEKAKKENDFSLRCSICKSHQHIDFGNPNFYETFPKNYSLLSSISSLKKKFSEKCAHQEKAKKYVCLDEKCLQQGSFCQQCLRQNHFNCQQGCTIKLKEFLEIVDFEIIDNSEDCYTLKPLRETVKTRIKELKTRISSIIAESENLIKKELDSNRKNLSSVDFYLAHQKFFKSTYDEKSGKVKLRQNNESGLNEFTSSVKLIFDDILFEEINKSLELLMLSLAKHLENIQSFTIESVQPLRSKIDNANFTIVSNVYKPIEKNNQNFSFEDFFEKAKLKLDAENCWFQIQESAGFDEQIRSFAIDVVCKAFRESPFSFEKITTFLQNQFAKMYPKKKWKVVFNTENEEKNCNFYSEHISFFCGNLFIKITSECEIFHLYEDIETNLMNLKRFHNQQNIALQQNMINWNQFGNRIHRPNPFFGIFQR